MEWKKWSSSVVWYIIIIIEYSAQGQVLHCKRRNLAAVLPKAGLPPQTQERWLQFDQGLNRCGSFPLLSAPHSLFGIWLDLKRSEKILGALAWKWGAWIWLTGPSGLHRNSSQRLNISSFRAFDQIRDLTIPITLRPRMTHSLTKIFISRVIGVKGGKIHTPTRAMPIFCEKAGTKESVSSDLIAFIEINEKGYNMSFLIERGITWKATASMVWWLACLTQLRYPRFDSRLYTKIFLGLYGLKQDPPASRCLFD